MKVIDRANTPIAPEETTPEVGEFPLSIETEEDYAARLERADEICYAIDKHIEFESKLQGRDLSPMTLCPEQKVCMASDIAHLI